MIPLIHHYLIISCYTDHRSQTNDGRRWTTDTPNLPTTAKQW